MMMTMLKTMSGTEGEKERSLVTSGSGLLSLRQFLELTSQEHADSANEVNESLFDSWISTGRRKAMVEPSLTELRR